MVKKKHVIEGTLDHFPKYNIYLNVNHLEKGEYSLKIVHKNKVTKKQLLKNEKQNSMTMKALKFTIANTAIFICLTNCMDSKEKKIFEENPLKEEKVLVQKDTIKKMNLLDEQAKMLGKVFGSSDSEEGDKWKKVGNFQDMVEEVNLSPDIKEHLREQYKLYDLSLDPKKKDSLKLIFNTKFNEAMAKSISKKE